MAIKWRNVIVFGWNSSDYTVTPTNVDTVHLSDLSSNDFAGEVRPVLAEQRDRDLRNDPGDDARHGGAGYV